MKSFQFSLSFCGALLLSFSSLFAGVDDQELLDLEIRHSLVQVGITVVHFDDTRPWITESSSHYQVTGLVLPNRRILVLGNDIHNAALVEVTKFSSYKKVLARVTRRDLATNLAVLEVDDPSFFDDLEPLVVGRDPAIGRSLVAVKIDDVFRVHREEVRISGLKIITNSKSVLFPVTFFRSDESFLSGGILIDGKKLYGFLGYVDNDKNVDSILPSVLRAFMEDENRPFVSQGFIFQSLTDPVLQDYYGLPAKYAEISSGALVSNVIPGSSAYQKLKKNDIILSIAGKTIDQRGYYMDPRYGPQPGQLLFFREGERIRKPGEVVAVHIVRDRKELTLHLPLKESNGDAERIPYIVEGRPPYFVESGYVFVELSLPYVQKAFGNSWREKAVELAYLFDTERYNESDQTERIVLIAGVLPHEANRGFDQIRALPVRSVNGVAIRSVAGLKAAIERLASQNEEFCVIQTSSPLQIPIDLKDRELINSQIKQHYRLP